MKSELLWPFKLTNRANVVALKQLPQHMKPLIRLYEVASRDASRDLIRDPRTLSSLLQRSQPLSNGYYLWTNEAYHLQLILYDKWQTCSSENDRARMVRNHLQLANARFETSYDAIKPYDLDIIENMTISEQNAKILL